MKHQIKIPHLPRVTRKDDILLLLLVLGVIACSSRAWDNGLGLTPPMGWNSWNHFHCDIDETQIQQTAQALVDLGLDRLGYQYINLDDCWQIRRNASGYIHEDSNKFPSGIPALAEYVQALGLKFGLYSWEAQTSFTKGIRFLKDVPGIMPALNQDVMLKSIRGE